MRHRSRSAHLRPSRALLTLAALATTVVPLEGQTGLDGLGTEVEEMLEAWNLPGVAVAVIQDDAVTFARGFGVREAGGTDPVDEHTVFAVGSTSKAFTAAAVAMLVDEGKVDWDDPVVDHLPDFRLSDPWVTRQMRIRDLMAHNSGLLRGDRMWYASGRTRDEVLHQARHQPITYPLRATFQYNNIMWIAAGEVVEALAGTTWDAFLEDRLFDPLGMDRSTTSVKGLGRMTNVARPHRELPDGELRPIPYRNIDNAGPAGSINSTVVQMAQWVRLHLAMGEYGGQRLVSEAAMQEMHTGQMIMRKDGLWGLIFPDSDFLSYGLGWFLTDYRDLKMVSHGGNIDGMTAFVGFVPERSYGFVILVNLDQANAFVSALAHRLIDRLEGKEGPAWSERMLEVWSGIQEQAREQARKVEEERVEGTSPSLELARYAGVYHNEMYGEIRVEVDGGELRADFGPHFRGPLEHWHYDTFRAHWDDPGEMKEFMRFEIGNDGSVVRLHADIEGTIEFARRDEDASGDG